MLCQKSAENRLKKGKALVGKPIIVLSAFTERSITKWQKREKQLICLLEQIS
ncbi:MAG: hypothetical protein IKR46_04835 [Clostridia bacterium]|nr:hypothetical protein [Clostridia bacterium]